MMKLIVSDQVRNICPEYVGGAVIAHVINSSASEALLKEIAEAGEQLQQSYDTNTVKERSGIKATRTVYKKAGKDPSRYRPSCEQLARRILQGKGLYTIDTLVDMGNLISLCCGYTVAVLDMDKIEGDTLTLGIGEENEPYEAIGRGPLNIACMPVFRDAMGGVATPTSDNVRTQVGAETNNVLIIINGYDGNRESVQQAVENTVRLLQTYAQAEILEQRLF